MSAVIHAIYEGGVFQPIEPVSFPERSHVTFEVKLVGHPEDPKHLNRVHDILGRRHHSGRSDSAARHDEHQP